jgi:lipid II:glycine glycyltransferase (peptidoglycan interpeptide bridge formation enzyme)
MDIRIEKKNTRNLYETPLLHQSAFWSEVKHQQGFETQAFDIKVRESDISQDIPKATYLVDDILILLQDVGSDAKVGYVPYGPAIRPSDANKGPFLEELSESLREHLPPSCIMLRYDLPWESLWAKEEDNYTEEGEWVGPPTQSLQELRMNYGTTTWNLKKAGTDILPPDTAFLDLGKDLDLLLKSMKPKTRYNINLAQRKHVVVRKGSFADLETFYELYRQTCFRNQINLHSSSYFEAMFTNDLHKKNLDGNDTDFELLIAELDGEPLSAMFLTYSSTRATYLFGASSSEHRNLMSTYLLQWEAIQQAKLRGCAEYDLFGTAPKADPTHPMYGLYRFKMGFGGRPLHRMGCWDFPLQKENYRHYLTNEMVGKGYHLR